MQLIKNVKQTKMVNFKFIYFEFRGRGEHFQETITNSSRTIARGDGENFTLFQSVTIASYLAKKFYLAGQGEREQTMVEMYADQISDLVTECTRVLFERDVDHSAELNEKLHNEVIPSNLEIFETRQAQTKSGYFVESGPTFVDIYLMAALEWLSNKKDPFLEENPHVKKLITKK